MNAIEMEVRRNGHIYLYFPFVWFLRSASPFLSLRNGTSEERKEESETVGKHIEYGVVILEIGLRCACEFGARGIPFPLLRERQRFRLTFQAVLL